MLIQSYFMMILIELLYTASTAQTLFFVPHQFLALGNGQYQGTKSRSSSKIMTLERLVKINSLMFR